ncbi:MAG: hypothetical protein FD129_2548, partial [bacterium]
MTANGDARSGPKPGERKSAPDRVVLTSALGRLLPILWQVPLLAIPFAFFFAVLFGSDDGDPFWKSLLYSYQIALTISGSVMLLMWVIFHLSPLRVLREPADNDRAGIIRTSLAYTLVAIVGTLTGALLVNQFILPGFLGGGRQWITVGMFTLLFAIMGLAIAFALQFHQSSLDKARSDQELNLARRIQESFLVREFPRMKRMDIHA